MNNSKRKNVLKELSQSLQKLEEDYRKNDIRLDEHNKSEFVGPECPTLDFEAISNKTNIRNRKFDIGNVGIGDCTEPK